MQVCYTQLCLLCIHIILFYSVHSQNSKFTEIPVPSGSGQIPTQRTTYFKPFENHTLHSSTYLYSPYGSTTPGKNCKKIFHANYVNKVFVSSEPPALCGTKVVQYNNVLFKFLSLPR